MRVFQRVNPCNLKHKKHSNLSHEKDLRQLQSLAAECCRNFIENDMFSYFMQGDTFVCPCSSPKKRKFPPLPPLSQNVSENKEFTSVSLGGLIEKMTNSSRGSVEKKTKLRWRVHATDDLQQYQTCTHTHTQKDASQIETRMRSTTKVWMKPNRRDPPLDFPCKTQSC